MTPNAKISTFSASGQSLNSEGSDYSGARYIGVVFLLTSSSKS